MSNYQPKPDSGSLFKNAEKQKETHADYKGDALIDGVAYFIDAWVNETKQGKKYFGMKFKRKQKQPTQSQSNDDIP